MLMQHLTGRREDTSEDKSRCFLGKFFVMKELSVAQAHTRSERQFKHSRAHQEPQRISFHLSKKCLFLIAGDKKRPTTLHAEFL
jgi:hypothetical protein